MSYTGQLRWTLDIVALKKRNDWDDPDYDSTRGYDEDLNRVSDEARGVFLWLPHECDAWEIGGVEEAKKLRADLDAAIEFLEGAAR